MQESNTGNAKKGKNGFFGIPSKIVVGVLQVLCIFIFAFSAAILLLLHNSGWTLNDLGTKAHFYETQAAGEKMDDYLSKVGNIIRLSERFKTDGKINQEVVVDIMHDEIWEPHAQMMDESSFNRETSYTLGQLEKMSKTQIADELNELSQSYYYDPKGVDFETPETKAAIKRIEELSGADIDSFSDKFIYMFKNGKALEEAKGQKTAAGETLAEYAAKNKDTVSLQELYEQLTISMDRYTDTMRILSNTSCFNNSNFRFFLKAGNGHVYTNVPEWKDLKDISKIEPEGDQYICYNRQQGMIDNQGREYPDNEAGRYLSDILSDNPVLDTDEMVYLGMNKAYPEHDELYRTARMLDNFMPYAQVLVVLGIISIFLWMLLLILGTIQAGKNPYHTEIHLYWLDKIPTEIGLAVGILVMIGLAIGPAFLIDEITSYERSMWVYVLSALVAALCYAVFLLIYSSIVRRIKAHNLWEQSLVKKIADLGGGIYKRGKTSTKMILVYGVFIGVNAILIISRSWVLFFFCMLLDALVLLYLMKKAEEKKRVLEGLERIGSGDLEYKVDVTDLSGDNLKLAETVNHVGDGLSAAISDKLKSERLKADLITNVSHDIKTPLTSIINYVDLLKRENFQDPKIKGYIDVLVSKSWRLKQLTEDLVEASKVSSGNVKLEFITINLNELVQQMNGEFDEKFKKSRLSIVPTLTTDALCISADSRHMWRVLENLYSNVVKYGMPGTRVYVETRRDQGKIIFSMKNISENPLNFEADELTERFIRGDVARKTEGSGLGLSIASELTRLLRGTFHIYLDGDLFKVTLSFDEVKELPH